MKYIILLFTLNLTLSLQFVYGQYDDVTVFEERFDNNVNKWYISNTEETKSQIVNGKLIDEFHNKGHWQVNSIYVPIDGTEDRYKISFSIANINYYIGRKRNAFPIYGFAWGFQDWNNYNYIIFQQEYRGTFSNELVVYYKIGSKIAGNEIVHKDWERDYDLKIGTAFNQITIEKEYSGSNTVSIKSGYNTLGYNIPTDKWASNRCGVLIGSGAKVMLDYLTIKAKKKNW